MKDIDLPVIFESMKKNDINEVIIKVGNISYQVRRGVLKTSNVGGMPTNNGAMPAAQNQAAFEVPMVGSQFINNIQTSAAKDGNDKNYFEVKSPLVGTFYSTPKPDAPPFVDVGTKVSKGQVLCVIEAMKNFNEITSEVDGVVKELCVKNGEIVEYGKILFRIETI